ncbi:MAG: potassium/proton antiporter, partial [Acidimicrobiia bacterium]
MDAQPWVLAAAALLIAGVLASKTSSRFGVPSLLLFLGLGMAAGSDGIVGNEFDDFELARSFGIIALGYILFSGGLGTRFADIRPVLGPGVALASVGVVLTAALLGGTASVLLDLPFEEGLLLGAIIASTDAAAVFSILRSRGVRINERLGSMLELESGSNDPAAVFLTIAIITVINEGETDPLLIVGRFALQMALGALAGYALARGAVWTINRLNLDYDGLYSVMTFGFVLLVLEGVTWIGGSGFLAVYVAGVTLAHHDYLHKRSLIRFHDAIAWLMQISMFVLLGLLVYPSRLADVVFPALATAAVLMFIARPIAVLVTLLPFRVPLADIRFVSWVGLRGATPIILATFPVVAGVPDADRVFDVVFFVVLTSVLIQGTTIPLVAKHLGLATTGGRSTRTSSFDAVITGDEGPELHEMTVEPGATAVGRQLVDLALPQGVLIVLIRRGPESFIPQGGTVIDVDDQLLVAAERSFR